MSRPKWNCGAYRFQKLNLWRSVALPGVRTDAIWQRRSFDRGDDPTIVWDMSNGNQIAKLLHDTHMESVAWSPDGSRLATSSWDQVVKIWDTATWREKMQLQRHADFQGWVVGGERMLDWSPDGSVLAAATARGWVICWDAATGREILSFSAHTSFLGSIAFSPDASRLATYSSDGSIKLWDASTGRQLLTLNGGGKISWSPDGTRLFTGRYIYDAPSMRERRE